MKLKPHSEDYLKYKFWTCTKCNKTLQARKDLYFHPTKHYLVCGNLMCQGEIRPQKREDLIAFNGGNRLGGQTVVDGINIT